MKKTCPLGHTCERRDADNEIIEQCRWYIRVHGRNPQTDDPIDAWDCAIAFLPILQIEGSKETRHTAAAVDAFRNEMVKQNTDAALVLAAVTEAGRQKRLERK